MRPCLPACLPPRSTRCFAAAGINFWQPSLLQMVLALLKFMRADYVCPAFPPTEEDASRHVTAFMLHAPPASEAAAAGAGVTEELFRVLLHYIVARSAEAHLSLRLFRELTQKLVARDARAGCNVKWTRWPAGMSRAGIC